MILTPEQFRDGALAMGMPGPYVDALVDLDRAYSTGTLLQGDARGPARSPAATHHLRAVREGLRRQVPHPPRLVRRQPSVARISGAAPVRSGGLVRCIRVFFDS